MSVDRDWASDNPVTDDLLPSVSPIRLLEERLAEDPEYLTRGGYDPVQETARRLAQ